MARAKKSPEVAPPPAPTVPHVLTDEQVAFFKLCIKKWQGKLNLRDWRINLSSIPAPSTCLAMTDKFDLAARLVRIRINRNWGPHNPVTSQALDELACHELLHVLLYEVIAFSQADPVNNEGILSAEHRLIQTVLPYLLGIDHDELST